MDSKLRKFGTEISANRQGRVPFKSLARAAICAAVAAGQSKAAVARAFGTTRQTVFNTIRRATTLQSLENKKRPGRPRLLNIREERYLLRLVRRFPKSSWKELVARNGHRVSARTLRRILQRYKMRKWKSKERPALTDESAAERMAFCRFWKGREEELASVSSLVKTAPRQPRPRF